MVPARNLLRRHYDTYGGGCSSFVDADAHFKPLLRSNPMMTSDDHHHPSTPTTTTTKSRALQGEGAQISQQHGERERREQDEESSADQQEAGPSGAKAPDDSWLQLGIGVSPSSSSSTAPATAGPSVELELFSDKPSSSSSSSFFRPAPPPPPPMFSTTPAAHLGYRPPPPAWGFGWSGGLMHVGGGGGGSMQQMMMMPHLYNVPRFSLPLPPTAAEELRVVGTPSPPARQHAGVWFMLKAAENQVEEPFLPQIPKSYIRIKDGRMTVRLLMKYLVKKLGLEDESQVRISCRGQPLLPFLTLQHVRDHIWCLSDAVSFLPDSPSADHVMTLQYSRTP